MTTRRADPQSSPGRSRSAVTAVKAEPPNSIASHTLKPVHGDAQSDPSPFSRPQQSEDDDSRRRRIEQAAYRRAESRGFEPGHEMEDWLAAEREIDQGSSNG
jgi:hypothetical protein